MRKMTLADYDVLIERMRALGMLRSRWDRTPDAWAVRKKPAALATTPEGRTDRAG